MSLPKLPTVTISISCLLLASCESVSDRGRQPDDRPNVLLVMVDDLGTEWIGAYGTDRVETPNLDALADSGMRFDAVWSMPQCTPTRVTLLTGQYPFRHGWTNHWDVPRWGAGCHFDPELHHTLPQMFQQAGYATAAAGKWQVNDFRVQPDAMARHGFDDWAMWTGYETENPPSGKRYFDPYVHTPEGSETVEGRFGPDVFTDFLIDFMVDHQNDPMFLYFPMVLTHGPLTPTPHEPDLTPREKECFPAMVRYVDHLMGRLLAQLSDLGLRDDTIVIFTTDNGSPRGITGGIDGTDIPGGKGTLGQNGMLTPFLISWPRVAHAGSRSDALIDFTDLLPTLTELAGIDLPADAVLDGHSFAPVVTGDDSRSPREWALSMGFGPAKLTVDGVRPVQPFTDRAVRDQRYKLWVQDGESSKLFDLLEDPWETQNLLEDDSPEVRAARERLEAIVAQFPAEDAAPRYVPTPPQSWDRKPKTGRRGS